MRLTDPAQAHKTPRVHSERTRGVLWAWARSVSRIYWDTMLFVYWLEDHPEHAARMNQIHKRMEARRDTLCTSALTLGEVLTGLYKRGAREMAARISERFRPPLVQPGEHFAQR